MKKQYNETAEKLYNEAKDAGLYDIAENIKAQYKVNRKYKTINEWLKTDIERDILMFGNWSTSYVVHTLIGQLKNLDKIDKETQSLINETFSSFILNRDEEFMSREEAIIGISVNYEFINNYTRKALLKLGYHLTPIEKISVNIENHMNKCFVEYPNEDRFAFQSTLVGNIFGTNSPSTFKETKFWIKQ